MYIAFGLLNLTTRLRNGTNRIANDAVYRLYEGVHHFQNVINSHGWRAYVTVLTSHEKRRATLRRFLRKSEVHNSIADLFRPPLQNFTPTGQTLCQVRISHQLDKPYAKYGQKCTLRRYVKWDLTAPIWQKHLFWKFLWAYILCALRYKPEGRVFDTR